MKKILHFLVFFVLGIIGTYVDFAYYYYLNSKGVFFVISFVIAFLCSFIVSFNVHKNITFNSKNGEKQLNQYLFISIRFLLIGLVMTSLLVIFGLLIQWKWLDENRAKVIIGFVLLWPNYQETKKVFKNGKKLDDT